MSEDSGGNIPQYYFFKKICIIAQTIDTRTHVPCISYYLALLDTRLK